MFTINLLTEVDSYKYGNPWKFENTFKKILREFFFLYRTWLGLGTKEKPCRLPFSSKKLCKYCYYIFDNKSRFWYREQTVLVHLHLCTSIKKFHFFISASNKNVSVPQFEYAKGIFRIENTIQAMDCMSLCSTFCHLSPPISAQPTSLPS